MLIFLLVVDISCKEESQLSEFSDDTPAGHTLFWHRAAQEYCRHKVLHQDTTPFQEVLKKTLDDSIAYSVVQPIWGMLTDEHIDCRGYFYYGIIKFPNDTKFNSFMDIVFFNNDEWIQFDTLDDQLIYYVNFRGETILLKDIFVDIPFYDTLKGPIGVRDNEVFEIHIPSLEERDIRDVSSEHNRYSEIFFRKNHDNEIEINAYKRGHPYYQLKELADKMGQKEDFNMILDTLDRLYVPVFYIPRSL